jgi:REP element-mobilizing transposase RayT
MVCPTKYRRALVTAPVEATLGKICSYLETCYEITFLEIGTDLDHVHFLIQSVPTLSPSRLAQIIKSITARELRTRLPGLRDELWGAAFWSSGYFVNTVSRRGSEATIRQYLQQQGLEQDYRLVHSRPLELF